MMRELRAADGILRAVFGSLAIWLLVASAAVAQTGDCPGPTSTTWEVLDPGPRPATIRFTFYAAGLANDLDVLWRPNFDLGEDPATAAAAKCPEIEEARLADEINAAMQAVYQNPDAELVQPAFPEICAPQSPATTANECRRMTFHQALMAEVWPEPATTLIDYVFEIFDWADSPGGQGGAGFNPNQRLDWFGVRTAENWSEQRFNNLNAVVTAIRSDETNHGGKPLDPIKP